MVDARTSSIPSASATRRRHGGQRGEQQDDSQVGVGVDDLPGCLDRRQHGAADTRGFRPVHGVGDRRRAQEKIDEVQPGQVGMAVHVSGLGRGHLEQASDLRQPARRSARAGSAERVDARRSGPAIVLLSLSRVSQGRQDRGGDVDARDARERPPAGDSVDLEHDELPAVEVGDQVDAGHLGPDRTRRRQSQPLGFGVDGGTPRPGRPATRSCASPFPARAVSSYR